MSRVFLDKNTKILREIEEIEFQKSIQEMSFQARNQEFFRAGEVSQNKGTSINI